MAENDRTTVVLDGTQIDGTSGLWWLKPEAEIGAAMCEVAQKFEVAQFDRRETGRRYVQLFLGRRLMSVYDAATARRANDDLYAVWNVLQAAQNTAASVVARNRVRVVFETSGADYELQEAAKMAELAIQGIFARNKVYERLDPLWFLDAGITDLGTLLVEPDRFGNTTIERVMRDELIFSEVEAIDGKPRQFFRVKWRSKWSAIEEYGTTPAKRAAIESALTFDLPLPGVIDRHVPLVPIYTGWFLPPAYEDDEKKGVGRRVVGIPGKAAGKGGTLDVRHYRHPQPPLVFYRVEDAPAGLDGVGFGSRLAGFQYRLNELNMLIEEAARRAVGKWAVESSSNVNPAELNNATAGLIKYTGKPPEYITIKSIPEDLLNERTTVYQQALKELGLSEWSVGGVQPDNIESGEGLRALREREQGRALPAGQHWEASHVELGEACVRSELDGFEIAKKNNTTRQKISVKDPDGDGLREVDMERVAKFLSDPDAWQITAYPTSALPTDPAGRLETLREWKADGTIDAATFAALSEMPDLNQESSHILAGIKAVRYAINQILTRGEVGYEPPDPAMPLELGIKIAQSTYLKGLRTGVPEVKLALLSTWIGDARDLLNGNPPPAAPGTAPGTAPPGGPSGAPPPAAAPAPGPAPMPPGAAPASAPPGAPPALPSGPVDAGVPVG